MQFLRERFSCLDIEVDGGLSPSTIDAAAQVCAEGGEGGGGMGYNNLGHVQYLLYMTL